MKDEDLDQILNTWADHETESAPDLRPTPAMYRMVRAKTKRKPSLLAYPRWSLAGAAVAALLILVVSHALVVHPLIAPKRPSGERVAHVGLRKAYGSDKSVKARGTAAPKGKGPRRGATPLRQLVFQFQHEGSRFIEAIDLQGPQEESLALTASDNYRLLLEPAADQYVLVFQVTSSGALVRLFPNETYGPAQNPLREGQTLLVPSEPNWLHLDETTGEERLYVVASAEPLQEVEDLYEPYVRAEDESAKQQALSTLLTALDAIEETCPSAASWVYAFKHR